MKKKWPNAAIGLLLLIGAAVLLYPNISDWLTEQNSSKAIVEYNMNVAEVTAQAMEENRAMAREYNATLLGMALEDPFMPGDDATLPDNYTSILNVQGIMGYIQIPKIDVGLPIYHGTGQEVLYKGIGHIENTAFPIGGEGNHVVLTGHRGLPTARLFTNLDQMEMDDVFYLRVLDETLAYQVDQILVVEPEDTEALRPVEGKDYVTLVTCTPYAINSHRLLVRGTRIPHESEADDLVKSVAGTVNGRELTLAAFAAFSVILLCVCVFTVRRKRRGRR